MILSIIIIIILIFLGVIYYIDTKKKMKKEQFTTNNSSNIYAQRNKNILTLYWNNNNNNITINGVSVINDDKTFFQSKTLNLDNYSPNSTLQILINNRPLSIDFTKKSLKVKKFSKKPLCNIDGSYKLVYTDEEDPNTNLVEPELTKSIDYQNQINNLVSMFENNPSTSQCPQ